MNDLSHPRQWRFAVVFVFTSIVLLLLGMLGQAQTSTVIASDITTSSPVNLLNYDNPWRDAFGAGDAFQIMAVGSDEPADGIPFAQVDDSAGVFVGDTQGIIDSATDFAPFFGATDTFNGVTSDPVTATWTFDISGATDLVLNVDVAAMGDFESNDSFIWSIALDGGAPVTLAAIVDESISTDYTLANGTTVNLSDPMTLNGTVLTNVFQTFSIPIAQTGSELELSFTAQTDGGTEAFAFRNVIIEGVAGGDSGTPAVHINEIRIDQPGADNDEYFELFAPAGTSLDGLTYLVIGDGAGGSGVIDAVVDLSGQTVSASGFFTVAEGTFTLGTAELTATLNFENSDNVTHLLVSDFTGTNDDDLDTDDDGILDSTPWTDLLDSVGLVETPGSGDLLYSNTLVGPDGSFVPGHVFRCPDGDGAWQIGAFGLDNDTPGDTNDCGGDDPGDPGDPQIVFIHEIQGAGDSVVITTPVIVEAVVIGDYSADNQLDGFFIQEEDADADGDSATSEGIFVYCGSNNCGSFPAISVGDVVRITGTPNEFFNMSQLNASTVEVLSSGNPLPAPATISLPITAPDLNAFYEQYEGMLVSYENTLVVSEYFQLARYGEIVLYGDARPYQFTDDNAPDVAGYSAHVDALARNRVILDDDDNTQNSPLPDGVLYHPQPNGFGVGTQGVDFFRGGDTVTNLTGVLHWSFAGQSGTDAWRIRPVPDAFPINFNPTNPRQATPAPVGGNVTVASLNVLNYFTSIDGGDCSANPANQCRGADSEAELARQTQQTVSALATMDADVVGLVEIENNGTAVSVLVDALNAQVGAGTYAYINTGIIGTDAITVAVIYKPAVVTPVGTTAVLDDPAFVDPLGYGVPRSRPAVAQTFEVTDISNPDFGGTFTVVVNHLKSKGAGGCSGADCAQNDGAGAYNATRTAGADYLVNIWLPTNPTGVDNTNVLILGDLNAYANETPITTLESAGYSDLLEIATGGTGYTYVFDGQLGYLDYIMASSALTPQVTGTSAWNVNSDEVSVFDYNDPIVDSGEASFEAKPSGNELFAGNGYRNSDHDPLIVGLDLDVPVATGTFEIVKIVDWNGAPISDNQAFEICVNGLELDQALCNVFDFDGGTVTLTDLPIGIYTVAETDPGTMWTVSGEGAYSVMDNTTSTVIITNTHVASTPDPTDEPTPDPTDEPTPEPTSAPTAIEVTGFLLVNAETDTIIGPLVDGDVIDIGTIGTRELNIIGIAEGAGSMIFSGSFSRIENAEPFTVGGDIDGVDYRSLHFENGAYSLTATGYTRTVGNGIASAPVTINFTVIDSTPDPTDDPTPDPTDEPTPDPTDEPTPDPTDEPTPDPTDEPTPEPTDEPTPEPTPAPTAIAVTGFLLVNAETDTIIGPLVDGDVIDTDAIGTRELNIIGIAEGAGSMIFSGSFSRTENAEPFTVGGDIDGVDYWSLHFDNGAYSLTATGYTRTVGNGIASAPVTINFTVIGNN
ncbi:MAG: ExeM/NucH family extracellular endonuclease [Anaerolineae bacterium]